jgi:hypothetical protein
MSASAAGSKAVRSSQVEPQPPSNPRGADGGSKRRARLGMSAVSAAAAAAAAAARELKRPGGGEAAANGGRPDTRPGGPAAPALTRRRLCGAARVSPSLSRRRGRSRGRCLMSECATSQYGDEQPQPEDTLTTASQGAASAPAKWGSRSAWADSDEPDARWAYAAGAGAAPPVSERGVLFDLGVCE